MNLNLIKSLDLRTSLLLIKGLRGKKRCNRQNQNARNRTNDPFFFFFFQRKRKKFKKERNQLIGFRDIAIQSNQRPLFQPGLTIFKKKKEEESKRRLEDFPGGPVLKQENRFTVWSRKTPHAMGQLGLEFALPAPGACALQQGAATAMRKVCTVTRAAPAKVKAYK